MSTSWRAICISSLPMAIIYNGGNAYRSCGWTTDFCFPPSKTLVNFDDKALNIFLFYFIIYFFETFFYLFSTIPLKSPWSINRSYSSITLLSVVTHFKTGCYYCNCNDRNKVYLVQKRVQFNSASFFFLSSASFFFLSFLSAFCSLITFKSWKSVISEE